MKIKKKKIIIIGGTGFLGYHLAKYCLKKIWTVISISRNKPIENRILKKVIYKFSNITNKKKLSNLLNKIHNIDFVVNFGGEVNHVKKTKTLKSHYYGTVNLSKILIKKKIKKFVQIGSSLEYGKRTSPHQEQKKALPISNYGKAKYYATNYLLNLYKQQNFPVIILRPYQIYGTHQDFNRLIPFVINQCILNNKFDCSEGKQYRDFLFVNDFINLVVKCLLIKNFNGHIFNVGSGKPVKIKKIIKIIKKKM